MPGFIVLEPFTAGDLLIFFLAVGYGVYAWRVGVPKILREQNRDLKERNALLEDENKEYLVQVTEMRSRVTTLESRVHELEAKGTEQIYNLILNQGKQLETSLTVLAESFSRVSVTSAGKLEVEVEAKEHGDPAD